MNIGVILAGGVGSRMGLEKPKQFLKVAGKTILEHSIDVFEKNHLIDEIAIVIHPSYIDEVKQLIIKNKWYKVKKILSGGNERFESSLSAIRAYDSLADDDKLIFHDSVRPLISSSIISDVVKALDKYRAVDVAINTTDTMIRKKKDALEIDSIPEREYLMRGQTPQAFHYNIIKKAYDIGMNDDNFKVTDDCGVVKTYLPDEPIGIVYGSENNIKLTHIEDIYLLDKLFQIKAQNINPEIDLNKLNGKIITVFGGNSGIGKDIAELAEEYGAAAYSFSRSQNNIDIRNPEDVEKALLSVYEKAGRIDYIINTAAVLSREPFIHMSNEKIHQMIDINYYGTINVSLGAYEYLKKSQGQLLHFTSSSYTLGRAFYSLYSSTKAAVVNFVQAIASEWESDGIRVNCINPERTKTPMRVHNFGIEDDNTLLDSKEVAAASLKALLDDFTGEVIDVKIKNI